MCNNFLSTFNLKIHFANHILSLKMTYRRGYYSNQQLVTCSLMQEPSLWMCVSVCVCVCLRARTCVVLGQVLVFVLLLLLAKPGAARLLLLLGFLHGDARHSPATHTHTHAHTHGNTHIQQHHLFKKSGTDLFILNSILTSFIFLILNFSCKILCL